MRLLPLSLAASFMQLLVRFRGDRIFGQTFSPQLITFCVMKCCTMQCAMQCA
uniref:Secreted protein n=1 Tax=Mesocestoides corti TaxID=53468 RepID=A0A5K3G251_MESCO